MRRTTLPITFAAAALAAGLTALAAPAPAAAAARVEAPWCAVMQTGWDNLVTDCSFWTLEQCVPNVISGNRGFCEHNPAYQGPPPRKKTYRSRR